MTKLLEWLAALLVFAAVWFCLISGKIAGFWVKEDPVVVYSLPLIALGVFGVVATCIVLYRTFTFNTCEKAANELQLDIAEAKEELAKRGYTFKKQQ